MTKSKIRKRAKSILHTYMKDGDKDKTKYYFSAIKYILKYG